MEQEIRYGPWEDTPLPSNYAKKNIVKKMKSDNRYMNISES